VASFSYSANPHYESRLAASAVHLPFPSLGQSLSSDILVKFKRWPSACAILQVPEMQSQDRCLRLNYPRAKSKSHASRDSDDSRILPSQKPWSIKRGAARPRGGAANGCEAREMKGSAASRLISMGDQWVDFHSHIQTDAGTRIGWDPALRQGETKRET
jgi:hypothetical protein